jgi:hypothetical protein
MALLRTPHPNARITATSVMIKSRMAKFDDPIFNRLDLRFTTGNRPFKPKDRSLVSSSKRHGFLYDWQ